MGLLDVRVANVWVTLIFLFFLSYVVNITNASEITIVLNSTSEDQQIILRIVSSKANSFKLLIEAPLLETYTFSLTNTSLLSTDDSTPFFEEASINVLFSNAYNQSLEIELMSSGDSSVALLGGHRKVIQRDLIVNYTAAKVNSTWLGETIVPTDYLPLGVTEIGVFASCGNTSNIDFYARHLPTSTQCEYSYSTPFKRNEIVPQEHDRMSSTWRDSLHGDGEYWIMTTWDSKKIDHPDHPVIIHLEKNDETSFKIWVTAPLYSDVEHPPGLPGEPFFGLWDYEVAKIFLLNSQNQYVAIELSPHGQYLVMLFNGYRKIIRHNLFINYTAEKTKNSWRGTAVIPNEYLPPMVTKMNAFAIHGSGKARTFESLYPSITPSQTVKDFHKLEDFKPFNASLILSETMKTHSLIWKESLEGARSFKITHDWRGRLLKPEETVDLKIMVQHNSLVLWLSAPLYNDKAPNKAKGPYPFLHDFEVVHFFLLNADGEYLEVQLGPHGHYLVAFKPYWQGLDYQKRYPISYHATRTGSKWNGTALIPLLYLPPRVNKCNAFSTHGIGKDRKYNSLYPVPTVMEEPDYELTQYFREIDFSLLHPGNEAHNYSRIWQEAIQRINMVPNNSADDVAGKIMNIIFVLICQFLCFANMH